MISEAKKKSQRELMRKRRAANKEANTPANGEANRLTQANKELETEVIALRAEVARLKQSLAQRVSYDPAEVKLLTRKRTDFVSPYSKKAQASLMAMPYKERGI